ncbi:MAG: hypothetical protein OXM01_13250 [Gemmatimonadota bacterium]|nr:hypothetical protein [Gemmatimonadota bacterium]
MKTLTLHSTFLALFGLILSPLTAAYASSPPADSGHLCQPVDLKPWQLDRLRPAGKRLADLDVGAPRTVRMIYFLPKDRQAQPDRVQVEAFVDAEAGLAQLGEAVAQCLYLLVSVVGIFQLLLHPDAEYPWLWLSGVD